jgi:hypothetical protein
MTNNKERTTRIDQANLVSHGPPASIGEDRTQLETKTVKRIKGKLVAKVSKRTDGAKSNVANITDAIGRRAI